MTPPGSCYHACADVVDEGGKMESCGTECLGECWLVVLWVRVRLGVSNL